MKDNCVTCGKETPYYIEDHIDIHMELDNFVLIVMMKYM